MREAIFFLSRGETPRTPQCRLGWQAAGKAQGQSCEKPGSGKSTKISASSSARFSHKCCQLRKLRFCDDLPPPLYVEVFAKATAAEETAAAPRSVKDGSALAIIGRYFGAPSRNTETRSRIRLRQIPTSRGRRRSMLRRRKQRLLVASRIELETTLSSLHLKRSRPRPWHRK